MDFKKDFISSSNTLLSEYAVGGKFAKQSRMIKAGISVPAFFCLNKVFFAYIVRPIDAHIRSQLNAIDFSSSDSIHKASNAIRDLFIHLQLDTATTDILLSSFDKNFAASDFVSVRASVVGHKIEESEDSISNPFAGMSESFLYVKRDDLLEKIKRCWASGFSYESLIYRHQEQLDLFGFSVAVGVQKMVFATKSFVMFTCHPQKMTRDMVIIAGYGLGEGVVQEKVEVDHYFVSQDLKQITKDISEKTKKMDLNQTSQKDLQFYDVPKELQSIPCLSDGDIKKLSELGRKIESVFGMPQDIEGCLTETGEVFILQSRPVSFDFRKQRVYSNVNVSESYPGVTTALTYSVARQFYKIIFYDMYRLSGVSAKTLNDNRNHLEKMVVFIKGRIYYSLTAFYFLHSQAPLWPLFKKKWEDMIGLESSFHTNEQPTYMQILSLGGQVRGVVSGFALLIYRWIQHGKNMDRFYIWWEKIYGPHRGKSFAHEDPMILVEKFNHVWREVGNWWGHTLTNDMFIMMSFNTSEHLLKKLGLMAKHPSILNDLLCGDEKLKSVEILLSAVNLSEIVNADPLLKTQVTTLSSSEMIGLIMTNRCNEKFANAFKQHLHFNGDRGLQELLLERKSLRDSPEVLLDMVKQYVSQNIKVQDIRDKENAVRAEAQTILNRRLRFKPFTKMVIEFTLMLARRAVRDRENSRYCRSELFNFNKMIFDGLGQYLVRRKVLSDISDVFHLTREEIIGFIDGSGVNENLQYIADQRRKEMEENQKQEISIHITAVSALRENSLNQVEQTASDGQLKGLGSSSGKVRGKAKVVIDPTSIKELEKGTILIARETDPGWLFLMLASTGMVVERGSMLSHTAITGRKFGIPTIVALKNATTIIPDGALIEMDGATGEVHIVTE